MSVFAHTSAVLDLRENPRSSSFRIEREKYFERIRHPVPRHARVDNELFLAFSHFLQERIDLMIVVFLYSGGDIHLFIGKSATGSNLTEKIARREMPIAEG